MHSYEEKQQLQALGKGDKKAFDALFRNYFPKLKNFLDGFLHNENEAEDLAQDIFVKLWQNHSLFIHIENLNAYLYTAAKNMLYNYIERSQKTKFLSIASVIELPTIDKLEELLAAKDLESLIDCAVEKMPPQRKTIFNLSRKEGLSNKKIALHLHISKRTVETHISAALSDIRKALRLFLFFF